MQEVGARTGKTERQNNTADHPQHLDNTIITRITVVKYHLPGGIFGMTTT